MAPSFEWDEPCSIGGRNELGIRRRRSLSRAVWIARWSDEGSCGMMFFRICDCSLCERSRIHELSYYTYLEVGRKGILDVDEYPCIVFRDLV